MSSHLHDLVNYIQVVLQVVLLLGVKHIAGVANSTLGYTASLENSLDTDFELVDVVESIKDTENVDTILLGLLDEVLDGIVGKRRVGDAVGTTQEHLERNVGHQLPHLPEAVP